MSVHRMCGWCPWSSEEAIGSLGAGGTGIVSPCRYWELHPGFLQEQPVTLTIESSLQPLHPLLIESCLCYASSQGPAFAPDRNRKCLSLDRHRRELSLRSKAIAPESWTQLHSECCLPDSSCLGFYWQSLHSIAWLCYRHHTIPQDWIGVKPTRI